MVSHCKNKKEEILSSCEEGNAERRVAPINYYQAMFFGKRELWNRASQKCVCGCVGGCVDIYSNARALVITAHRVFVAHQRTTIGRAIITFRTTPEPYSLLWRHHVMLWHRTVRACVVYTLEWSGKVLLVGVKAEDGDELAAAKSDYRLRHQNGLAGVRAEGECVQRGYAL